MSPPTQNLLKHPNFHPNIHLNPINYCISISSHLTLALLRLHQQVLWSLWSRILRKVFSPPPSHVYMVLGPCLRVLPETLASTSIFTLTNLPNQHPRGFQVRFLITIFTFWLFKCLQTRVNWVDLFGALYCWRTTRGFHWPTQSLVVLYQHLCFNSIDVCLTIPISNNHLKTSTLQAGIPGFCLCLPHFLNYFNSFGISKAHIGKAEIANLIRLINLSSDSVAIKLHGVPMEQGPP